MVLLKRVALLLLLLLYFSGFSQNRYFTAWYSADNNHLPQNSVKSITEDKYGYIWLTTESGLVRYDGQNFKIFNSENIKGITSDRMGSFGGSIEKDSIIIRNEPNELIIIKNRTAYRDSVNRFKPVIPIKNNKAYYLEFVKNISYAHEYEVWGFPSKNKYYVVSKDSIKQFNKNGVLQNKIYFTHKDSAQFFTLNDKLYLLRPDNKVSLPLTETNKTLPASHRYSKVFTNNLSNQVFLIAGNKILMLQEEKGNFKVTELYDNFNEDLNIVAMYYSGYNNTLYLGSTNKGLIVVRKQDFTVLKSPNKHAFGIEGVYYALTDYNDFLISSTGAVFKDNKLIDDIAISKVSNKYFLVKDQEGNLMVAKGNTLYRFKKSSGFKEFDSFTFDNNTRIISMVKTPEGKLWVACSIEKAGKVLKSNIYTNIPGSDFAFKWRKSVPYRVNYIYANNNSKLWLGAPDGLYIMETKTLKEQKVPGFNKAIIRSVVILGNDVWVTSYNKGFFLYRDGKTTNFPVDKNQYLLCSHYIMPDGQGFFWIPTNRGLFQVKKQDLYDYANGKKNAVYYYFYSKESGFETNEFNGGGIPYAATIGNAIFMPSMDGIVSFNPANVTFTQPGNDIFIDEAEIDNSLRAVKDSITLNRNFNRLKLYISSPYFGNHNNQNIEVKLSGPVSQDWIQLTENNIAFSTLPPGHYTLTARKIKGFGSDYIYRNFTFYVKPAFWQTTWFLILITAAVIVLIFFTIKLRLKYIRYKNIQLQKQITLQTAQLRSTIAALRKTQEDLGKQVVNHKNLIKTITHDIKSPLKFMAITGRYVYNNIDSGTDAVKDDVQAIYTSSSQLYHFVDQFLEYTKEADTSNNTEPFSLNELATEKMDFFSTIANYKNINLLNEIPKNLYVTLNRHLLSIILHNLLDNAIKNTYNGAITFSAYTDNEKKTTVITIKDSGKGMNAGQIEYFNSLLQNNPDDTPAKSMGLSIVAELLLILGGKAEINSSEHWGTQITLSFPQ
ncbi:ATP-binding protein [Flavobacterium sp. MK4S-17]|uniref:sensor histidine kinase n=1 Tax=Flavobacterium sp. MK4S-17 TaxID=2543737 RepID=UPI001356CE35|nr:ATP-binding protein [Flavobacterium sp. MK4S-17]